jgi:hypothetical protein
VAGTFMGKSVLNVAGDRVVLNCDPLQYGQVAIEIGDRSEKGSCNQHEKRGCNQYFHNANAFLWITKALFKAIPEAFQRKLHLLQPVTGFTNCPPEPINTVANRLQATKSLPIHIA